MSLFAATVLIWSVCAAPLPTPATGEEFQYTCTQEKWGGNSEEFVRDMLSRWRADYARLSTGEMRLKVQEILLGLQDPGQRYTIETMKKGEIAFENVDGVISCRIKKP